ncbi:MAG: hypothetical protein KJ906_00365 [Nanoarchaeota archaeon]|nr:hypothetical protein [Nanoarchaeota archaeon]
MAKKQGNQWIKLSGYLFLLGMLIAVIEGLMVGTIPSAGTLLVVLGFVVGLLGAFGMGSIGKDDIEIFMLAAIALMAVGASGAVLAGVPYVGDYLAPIVGHIAVLAAPAVAILAIEAIWKAGSIKYM